MPEYLAPGLFVEEIDSGSKPIEGVGTNTAAFIGYAKSGEYNTPTFVTSWSQFYQSFGEEENALTKALCEELKMTVLEVRTAQKAARKSWTEYASHTINRAIKAKTCSVKSWPEFLQKYSIIPGSPYIDGSYLAHAVKGYFDNGGGRAYIIRMARKEDIATLKYEAKSLSTPTPAAAATVTVGPLLITAKSAGASGNDIKVEVKHVGDEGSNTFTLEVTKEGERPETFGKPNAPLTLDTLADAVKNARLVSVTKVDTATETRPAVGVFSLLDGLDVSNVPATRAAGGVPAANPLSNGLASLKAEDFVGDEYTRTGLGGLAPIVDVNMICAPDLMAGVWQREEIPGAGEDVVGEEILVMTDEQRQAILDQQCALVMHCESKGDRMAILDPIPGLKPMEMDTLTMRTPYNCDHGQAAIYYPWIKVADPVRKGRSLLVPPCGHVAGVYARVAVERGVHKAPANESVRGAVGLEYEVSKGEQEMLNPDGINCIRAFPGTGIRIWGARTLATRGNPSWKYVNVRRLFNYLEVSLDRSLQWVVFEPNDDDLWGRVRRNIAAFLYTEWKEGKLFGQTPQEAFYVKCDRETNPQEMIDLGRLYCEIGVNPVKPAEFVIIRIGQWSGGGSMGEQ